MPTQSANHCIALLAGGAGFVIGSVLTWPKGAVRVRGRLLGGACALALAAVLVSAAPAPEAQAFECEPVAGTSPSSGTDGGVPTNTACGLGAEATGAGSGNVAVGNLSTANGAGSINTATGNGANAAGAGSSNTATGALSRASGTGSVNTAIGGRSGLNIFGANASGANSFNTAVGADADASGDFSSNTAIGENANASGDGTANMAFGVGAQASNNSIAIGPNSVATGSIAVGTSATASNGGAAFGDFSAATGPNSTAVGPNATATHANAAAFGNGATTTRANQQVFGTSANTYTMPGLASRRSKAAQGAPSHLVTSNASGDLAAYTPSQLGLATQSDVAGLQSDIDQLGRRDRKLTEGLAAVASLAQPILLPGQQFAMRAGWGGFDEANALSLTAAGVIASDLVQPGRGTLTLDGGVGVGTNEGEVAGRAGLTFGW